MQKKKLWTTKTRCKNELIAIVIVKRLCANTCVFVGLSKYYWCEGSVQKAIEQVKKTFYTKHNGRTLHFLSELKHKHTTNGFRVLYQHAAPNVVLKLISRMMKE